MSLLGAQVEIMMALEEKFEITLDEEGELATATLRSNSCRMVACLISSWWCLRHIIRVLAEKVCCSTCWQRLLSRPVVQVVLKLLCAQAYCPGVQPLSILQSKLLA
jgi:hypothetical protein